MMKKILVATDFSPAADNAAQYAADLALAIDADLCLLHVYQIPIVYYEVPIAVGEEDMRADIETKLLDLKNNLTELTEGKLSITTEHSVGAFFDELKAPGEKLQPYLVVMGSQGSTATERIFFGTHAVYAMQNLRWPLLTVPIEARYSGVKKIGLACDFKKVVDTLPIDEIKKIMTDFKGELHVLNTGHQEIYDADTVFESGMLQEMLKPLMPYYHFITHKDIDQGIIEFADNQQIDLLVVVPKRHGLLDKLTHKSHTKQLVLHSHIPVMALHE